MKKFFRSALLSALVAVICSSLQAQVDTTFIYNNNMPYGSLDLRIAKSDTWYYYLQEDVTFSFRESEPGVKTKTFFDMTSWDSSPYLQGNLREKSSEADLFVMNYRLLPPQEYNASYAEGYPMILVMHGLGESGNCSEHECHHADEFYSPNTNTPAAPVNIDHPLLNNDHTLTNGGRVHLKAVTDAGAKLPDDETLSERAFPGFVLFPQNLNGWSNPSVQDALRIVRLLTKKYNIDENRIYIHGLSNGGHGVFEAIKRAPWMFAAAATMSAIDDGFIHQQKMSEEVAHIPLWMFQGGLDKMPSPLKTENFVKKFRDAGSVVRYTKYDNLGHGTWNTAYNEPDFFSWLLGNNKATIHTFAGATEICPSTGLQLELPQGYLAYQWQLNEQTITDANTATYTATAAGTYRARFSRVANPTEADWNRWSDPVTLTAASGLPQAEIKQNGTVLLNDLNNYTNARLEAVGDFDHYYWYKDGVLVDFPGDQDDTIKHAVITPAMGNGAYTLVASNFDNCPGPASVAKHIFFNNEAPVSITAPTNFNATVNASSEVTFTWTDASSNENGFEVWRRRKTDATTFTPWEMAALTASDVTTFTETQLLPSSVYEYKIRAVSNTARSEYSPSAAGLEVHTELDTQAPEAPQELVAVPAGIQKMKLTWRSSTDNTGIKNYFIYFGTDSVSAPGSDTTFILGGLEINTTYTFTVKALDLSNNLSSPSNESQGNTYVSGLYYEHSTGVTFDLDSIDWSNPEFTGVVDTFTLKPKTQEDYFNFRFDGFLFITNEGPYQFRLGSNDGSRLTLDNTVTVDNDGVHDFAEVTSEAKTLTAGAHRIRVEFFDYNETDSLLVQYNGTDTDDQWVSIGSDVLKSSDAPVTGIDPDNGPEDSFQVSIYPNPSTQNNINVKLQTVLNSPVTIELLDPVGRRLAAEVVQPAELTEGIRISPSGVLPAGIYIITVNQEKITIRQRIIVKD